MIVAKIGDEIRGWAWPNFSPAELADRVSGELRVEEEFLDRLQDLRLRVGFPLPVTSGYRSPEHNAKVSSTGLAGPHTTGRAVDIGLSGVNVVVLVRAAFELGFTGIGLKQHGTGRFVHLDDLDIELRPRIWTYP